MRALHRCRGALCHKLEQAGALVEAVLHLYSVHIGCGGTVQHYCVVALYRLVELDAERIAAAPGCALLIL